MIKTKGTDKDIQVPEAVLEVVAVKLHNMFIQTNNKMLINKIAHIFNIIKNNRPKMFAVLWFCGSTLAMQSQLNAEKNNSNTNDAILQFRKNDENIAYF